MELGDSSYNEPLLPFLNTSGRQLLEHSFTLHALPPPQGPVAFKIQSLSSANPSEQKQFHRSLPTCKGV